MMGELPFPVPYLIGAIALVVLVAVLARVFRGPVRPPYQVRDDFLSPAELAFFRVLEEAVAGEHYIFPKVRIGDLLRVEEGTDNARGWFARIGQKHVDFVLADRSGVRPMLVIELDDSSHDRPDRQERDRFVNGAMEAAGLPMARFRVAQRYDAREVGEKIRLAIGG